MSDVVIVDASVALQCVFAEPFSTEAMDLVDSANGAGRFVVAPPLLSAEGTNAIYQRERRGEFTSRQADQALEEYLALPIRLVTPPDLMKRAIALSRRYKLPATYDSQYLVVALDIEAEFWTADTRLFNALPRSLRWAHHIADYRPDKRV